MKDIYQGIWADGEPLDFYEMLLTRDIIEVIVHETNLYATQELTKEDIDVKEKSRLHSWKPIDVPEMYRFLALLGWMGLVQLPCILDYWRIHRLYNLPFARQIMPRNRFELLLKFVHFSDNEQPSTDRLVKRKTVLDMLIINYLLLLLIFRQYIRNKRHKYGIKLFKLCTDKGFPWNIIVYCGKSKTNEKDVSEKVVIDLAEKLLKKGRTIYTDYYYTSIPLAYRLLHRKTALVGTLRMNRKHLPPDFVNTKLKKGELIGMETKDGKIGVTKWKDRRYVSVLSTKHSAKEVKMVKTKRRPAVLKPMAIVDYNRSKSSIDIWLKG